MKKSIHILLLAIRYLARPQEISILSELPFNELLAQKKIVEGGNLKENTPTALPLVGKSSKGEIGTAKDLREIPHRKTFYDEDYEDKSHVHKMKDEPKTHDILNTSIMALSYLAFGGYLLCMIASALREKRRRIMMSYPPVGSVTNNQFAHVLQHYVSQRPVRPFVRFPAVTVHQEEKKRRRRSNQRKTV